MDQILRTIQQPHQFQYMIFCPGCKCGHGLRTEQPGGWSFNGNMERPTFSPSLHVSCNGADAGKDGAPPAVCHSFIRDGQIQFLGDCTHALAGQTVPLPKF